MAQSSVFHLNPPVEQGFGYAQAVKLGNEIYISGTAALAEDLTVLHPGEMAKQIIVVYDKLEATLDRFGANFRHVVKETIFTTDIATFVAANSHRVSYLDLNHLPAATAVEVRQLLLPGLMLEVELVARLDKDITKTSTVLE